MFDVGLVSVFVSACIATTVYIVTKKDLAMVCAIAYFFGFGLATSVMEGGVRLEKAEVIMIGCLLDAMVMFTAAAHWKAPYVRLSQSLTLICVISLINNGLSLLHWTPALMYVGIGLQAATLFSLMAFDGLRGAPDDGIRNLCRVLRIRIGSARHNHSRSKGDPWP